MIRRALALATLFAFAPTFADAAPASVEPQGLPPLVLRLADGTTLALSERLGRGPILLDFWATWCRPCAVSLPSIQALHERYAARGLTVIGVSIDGPRNFSRVRPFASRLGLTYPIVLDEDGSLQERFRVRAVPTVLLFDENGALLEQRIGYRPGEEKTLAATIEKQLAATADSTGAPAAPAPDSTARGAR